MNGHRKLLTLAVNLLLERKLISLEGVENNREEGGHIFAQLAGENAAISWQGIGCEELRISVWWKYDHSRHPQANSLGNAREEFKTSSPLAKQQHYPKFVGATVSGWLERETGKFLQGKDVQGLFNLYTRRGEKLVLDKMPIPSAKGFSPEGAYFG